MRYIPSFFAALALASALFGQAIEVTSTGVGVGTGSPNFSLDIATGSGQFASPAINILPTTHPTSKRATIGFGFVGVPFSNNGWILGQDLNGAGVRDFYLLDRNSGSSYIRFYVDTGGNVGIGTTTPSYKVEVAGSVRATAFIADVNTYSDFVFKPGYKLAPLPEVEAAIGRDGHLPGIPGEAEARGRGLDLANQQAKLLQKVEELTLYAIEQNKRLDAQTRRLDAQAAAIEELTRENAALRGSQAKRAGR